jgi:hypothetical protein
MRPPHPSSDPQIIALSREIQQDLATSPEAATMALVDSANGAWDTLQCCPQLDEIAACYQAGPEDYCEFCSSGGLPHTSDPQELPDWIHELRGAKAAADATLDAIEMALAPSGETLELTDPAKFGNWLAQEYVRDRGNFYRMVFDLERDQSPSTQQALAIASHLIAGSRPAPQPLPGGNMSHTLAAGDHQRSHTLGVQRKYYVVEGNRSRPAPSTDTVSTGSGGQLPPPAPEPEPGNRRSRRRRRLR